MASASPEPGRRKSPKLWRVDPRIVEDIVESTNLADAGFGGPEVKMQQLKMRVRAIINAILDNKVHTAGMTEKEALALMMGCGFQEEGEAVGKWRRACQSSTQLSTYFVGAVEHDDMRAAVEQREGGSFDLKRYHDRALSRGSPAVKHVRRELGW